MTVILRLRSFILATLTCLLAPGCAATLPDARGVIGMFHGGGCSPTVVRMQQRLPAEEGRAVLVSVVGDAGEADVLAGHFCVMEAMGAGPISCGNRATLLGDGDAAFAAMLKAIGAAKDYINLETYIFHDDEMGRRFADLLVKKRSEGVTVNLIYDGFGCRRTPRSFFSRLRQAGVKTLEFNPVTPRGIMGGREVLRRTHRKLLIVDGSVAFTGGINIGSAYRKSRRPEDRVSPPEGFWRDTHIMIEGPAAAEFQRVFLATWSRQNGAELSGGRYFPDVGDKGDELVQVIDSTPGPMNRTTYVMYLSAIAHARKSVHITQSYFSPDEQMIGALTGAARRGVDVRIILPGITDHGVVRQAGRWRYSGILDSGVRLYERSGAILHAKTAVIDGVWSTVGTTNLESWSLATNDEVNAVVLGAPFAREMEAAFEQDLAQSTEILQELWRQRPISERVKEFFSNLIGRWL
ncbi:MAG: phospholipase D-like domain-containing protein [Syntrophorhabdales bacterium]|jgi:cardiolipin synthase